MQLSLSVLQCRLHGKLGEPEDKLPFSTLDDHFQFPIPIPFPFPAFTDTHAFLDLLNRKSAKDYEHVALKGYDVRVTLYFVISYT